MWAGGSWHQWPLQPSTFQNIPHEEIDWAALAQQWIQMKEIVVTSTDKHHLSQSQIVKSEEEPQSSAAINESSSSKDTISNKQGNWENCWNAGWNAVLPSWNPSAIPTEKEIIQTFDYGHVHGSQGFAGQSYDYNHGSESYSYNQVYNEHTVVYEPLWAAGEGSLASESTVRKDKHDKPISEKGVPPTADDTLQQPTLDAAKRKQLPAWIREGLEKMEREKQKSKEREKQEKEREHFLRVQNEAKATTEMGQLNRIEIPQKSKFDTDTDDASSVESKKSPSQVNLLPEDESKLQEDNAEGLMIRVRRMLTEILLDVTNEEIFAIAQEVHKREKIKAPALQLAKSSALASITGDLGLTAYGSDSDGSAAEEAYDSDTELQQRIEQRRTQFAEKEKEIHTKPEEGISAAESDDEKHIIIGIPEAKSTTIHTSPEHEKYHFERKYFEIPGLDASESDYKPVIPVIMEHEPTTDNNQSTANVKEEILDPPKNRKQDSSETDSEPDSSGSENSCENRSKSCSVSPHHPKKRRERETSRQNKHKTESTSQTSYSKVSLHRKGGDKKSKSRSQSYDRKYSRSRSSSYSRHHSSSTSNGRKNIYKPRSKYHRHDRSIRHRSSSKTSFSKSKRKNSESPINHRSHSRSPYRSKKSRHNYSRSAK